MEPTVLSGPLGHTQWESDQPFPLGFHTLDSDNGGVLCSNSSSSSQAGLDFRNSDQEQTCQQSEEENIFKCKPVELDNLISMFESDQSAISHIEELSLTEKREGPDEISDLPLSWLFSPKLAIVAGKTSTREELSLTPEDPLESSNTLSSQAELISLSVPVSPSKISDTNTGNPFLLVDFFSDENSCLPTESSGELNPQGVSEELLDLTQEEQASPPPSQSWETLSHETGDKGLFPDQVTDLPVTCSTSLQGSPESCGPQQQNHSSTPLEFFEGSVPLLDLDVPDCDSSLSLCPASPPSVISTVAPLDLSTPELEVEHEGATVIPTSEQQREDDSFAVGLSAGPSSLTVPVAEDAFIQGDFTSESYSVENESKDLMEDKIHSEAKTQGNEAMALDLCLTADEVHDEETWDLKPHKGVQKGSVPNPTTEQREEEGESLTDTNQLEGSDCHEVASFDFSVQDLHAASTPEAEWTSEQTVETISLSKMVVDDSLPMVSAVNTKEEDVSPLKAVFDALDQDGDGFVRIEEFMEFAAAYGADQVRRVIPVDFLVLSFAASR